MLAQPFALADSAIDADALRGALESMAVGAVVCFEGRVRDLHPMVRDEVQRIAEEAIRNAFHHASARAIEVIITYRPGRLSLAVRDNGVGLPEGQVGRGLGTQIVRTLIQGELSGAIDWHTIVGSGTEVTIEIPLRYIAPASEEAWVRA